MTSSRTAGRSYFREKVSGGQTEVVRPPGSAVPGGRDGTEQRASSPNDINRGADISVGVLGDEVGSGTSEGVGTIAFGFDEGASQWGGGVVFERFEIVPRVISK